MAPFLVKKVCILEVDVKASFIFLLSSSKFNVDCSNTLRSRKIEEGSLFDIFQRPQPPPRLLLEKQPPLGK